MKSFKTIILGLALGLILIAMIGCGDTEKDNRPDASDIVNDNCQLDVSESMLSVREITDEVNRFVAGISDGTAEAAEVKIVLNGFALDYAELANDIETSDSAETDELALVLATEGEERTKALAETQANNPGIINYTESAVVNWGEYADKVYASVGGDMMKSNLNNGDGKGSGKGVNRGYGWWDEDLATGDGQYRYGDKEQYQEREREQHYDDDCDGPDEGDGKGTGPRDGSGPGRGKGYGGSKGKGQ